MAGRTKAWPSAAGRRWTLNDGVVAASLFMISSEAMAFSDSWLTTSIGAADSKAVRSTRRVPVTTTVSTSVATVWAGVCWA